MPHTSRKRYAVVSCHVEQPLDDAAWARFARMQERRPGGFAITALVRPPDGEAGEDETVWVERARAAAARGPFGQHTHWTSPTHARPTTHGAAERVRSEGERLRELGLTPGLFCGGGWYTDAEVAEACAELGYVDCTPRAVRPSYLPAGAPWACAAGPSRVRLPSGRELVVLPTTHSLGDLARAVSRRRLPSYVHVYFHDTDLLSVRRRALLRMLLSLLARVAEPIHPAVLSGLEQNDHPTISWDDIVRI